MNPDCQHAPATLRNRDPIARVLGSVLPPDGLVLEVASGTGEHAVYFARVFPDLIWQPSDPSPTALRSIRAWMAADALPNLRPPVELDAACRPWPIARADALVCINMLHISPWEATIGLLAGAAGVLGRGAPLYVYGPFRRADHPLEPSNRDFDRRLRESDPAWGLRDVDAVTACATKVGLARTEVIEMPANNLSLVFRKN